MQFDKFEAFMMATFVGNVPQKKPSGMYMAVRIYSKLGFSDQELVEHDRQPLLELRQLFLKEEPVEIELDAEEAKFVAKTMVENANFGAKVLQWLIPLWERLYPKWEEFE